MNPIPELTKYPEDGARIYLSTAGANRIIEKLNEVIEAVNKQSEEVGPQLKEAPKSSKLNKEPKNEQ